MPARTKRFVASFIFQGTSRAHDMVTMPRASANLVAEGSVGAPMRTRPSFGIVTSPAAVVAASMRAWSFVASQEKEWKSLSVPHG